MQIRPSELGQRRIIEEVIAQSANVEMELLGLANDLRERCHSLIREFAAGHPCPTLAVRTNRTDFGPKIVWITYTPHKISLKSGEGKRRFTRELTGRKGGRYPAKTFTLFPPGLRPQMLEIEEEAAAIRQRVAHYRALLKWAEAEKKLFDNAENL